MNCSFDHLLAFSVLGFFASFKNYLLIFLGFSLVVFFHELGHFLAAKWCDVRVDRFAVGFGKTLMAYRKGVGFAWGSTFPAYMRRVQQWLAAQRGLDSPPKEPTEAQIAEATKALGIGETEYAFNALPLGGYVKMLGQEDFTIDKSGELVVRNDPRSFTHKPVGQRMIIVSAGVIMNLIFASVVFMLVFMIGMEAPAAKIGIVMAESPAEKVGMRVNDVITRIDGKRVSDFNDVMPAVMLAVPGETLKLTVERPMPDGQTKTIVFDVPTQRNPEENKLIIGVSPPFDNRVFDVLADPAIKPEDQVQRGDLILEVNGKKVSDLFDINQALAKERGKIADLKVLRPTAGGKEEETRAKRRARLVFRPTGDPMKESGHLLGFVPRREITIVNEGDRADEAHLRPGDVIVRFGQWSSPTRFEVVDTIRQNPEKDIPVEILRPMPDGTARTIKTQVRPKASGLFRDGKGKVGMDPDGQESDRLVVADFITRIPTPDGDIATPAAKIKSLMPRGALITKVDDQPVKTWPDLVLRFIELAGHDVKITWTYNDGPEQSASIYVPQTLGTSFELIPGERITRIDDKTGIEKLIDGRPVMQSAESWVGARELLRDCLDKKREKVDVEYRYMSDPTPKKATVTLKPEMLDTWVQRIEYNVVDTLRTNMVTTLVRVRNPITAMGIGLQKTYYFVEQVYIMMKRMVFTRSVSFDQVSGPVGIVKMGSEVASHDLTQLLYFLAVISANLALINFLPMPIVDGGLFMFLIIEKIKGSPISLRVMVVTQVIGIVLIIGVFLFVTFQDLQKLVG